MRAFEDVSKEEVRDLLGKGWLTHDGMWFHTVSRELGVETANKFNLAAIRAIAPFEVQRLKQLMALEESRLKSLEGIRECLPEAMRLILPVSVFSKLHFRALHGDILGWEWEDGACFAYKGMGRIGVIDRYECGVMYRVECWLELLGLKFTAHPPVGRCRMHSTGHCSGQFRFQF